MIGGRRWTMWATTLVSLIVHFPAPAGAEETSEARPPMPEPILNETTTDIDGTEPGELEIETNTLLLRSRAGGAFDLEFSQEIELLLTKKLGAKIEPFFERAAAAGGSPSNSGGVTGSLSWKLLQMFHDDFHLQGEIAGRVPTDRSTGVEPGESPLPLSLDLRSGYRRGTWTLRASMGVSAGGQSAHVPLRGSAGVFTGFEPTMRLGFWGIEVEADGARSDPAVVALDLVPSLLSAKIPFSFGFVLPYSIGADGKAPSYGFLVRLFIESEREREYGRGAHGN
jgi:hypothetical protein